MRIISFFAQLWVAAFVVFAGFAFVSLGFEFQGELFELVCWSAAAAVLGAIGYAILSKMFSVAFGLVSLGTLWEFLFGAVVGAALLYVSPMVAPAVLVAPLVTNAFIGGAISSGLVLAVRAVCSDGALSSGFLPHRK